MFRNIMTTLWNRTFRTASRCSPRPVCCKSRQPKARLTIDQLERRDCPALAITQEGQWLSIIGDGQDDVIGITDHGGGTLTVNGADYNGVQRLFITPRGGDDVVDLTTTGVLSLTQIQINLGWGDDIASLQLGTVEHDLRSVINGGAGADTIGTAFGAVSLGSHAQSFMNGGFGNDSISCVQNNVAGQASCISRGGVGDDLILCEKHNVLAKGQSECRSEGGFGDDVLLCTATDVAGHSACIGDGGFGNDIVACTMSRLTATGSALCQQSGGAGNDVLTCDKEDIHGQHVCFGNGGAGDDIMNWFVRGENSGDFQCTMEGGVGDDTMNIVIGEVIPQPDGPDIINPANFTGTVRYSADTGPGNDQWLSLVKLDAASDGVFEEITVSLGIGDDLIVLGFLDLGATTVAGGSVNGGPGQDVYVGPPPELLPYPVEGFETVN